jgi:hypothetical protein
MSITFSIAAHRALQYVSSEESSQVQFGCAHVFLVSLAME